MEHLAAKELELVENKAEFSMDLHSSCGHEANVVLSLLNAYIGKGLHVHISTL